MTATNRIYEEAYLLLLYQIFCDPITLQSNLARREAFYIAEAASRGHLTSLVDKTIATNKWYVTSLGKKLLKKEGYL